MEMFKIEKKNVYAGLKLFWLVLQKHSYLNAMETTLRLICV